MFYIYLIIMVCAGVYGYQSLLLYPNNEQTILQFITTYGYIHNEPNEWTRFITYSFVHYGFTHIAFNMLSLYTLSHALVVKLKISVSPVLLVYFAAIFTSVLLPDLYQNANYVTVGASGGIMGLAGFIFMVTKGVIPIKSRVYIGGVILLQILVFDNLVPGIDQIAHIIGTLTGVLFGYMYLQLFQLTYLKKGD